MDRRDFLKSLTVVAAGSTVVAGSKLLPELLQQKDDAQAIKFDKATLKRFSDNRWALMFESSELLQSKLQEGKELVAEIGDYIFLLKNVNSFEFSTEHLGSGRRTYIHRVSGLGWEQQT